MIFQKLWKDPHETPKAVQTIRFLSCMASSSNSTETCLQRYLLILTFAAWKSETKYQLIKKKF